MHIKQYIHSLRVKIHQGRPTRETQEKLSYAMAYFRGDEGLKTYRDREIAREICKVYDSNAQLAILFNRESEPEVYEAYQAFRVECKARVDEKMAAQRKEIEEILSK